MKQFILFSVLLMAVIGCHQIRGETMSTNGIENAKVELKLPLLISKGSKGFLACGYINVETCNKTGEACAIVSGVKTHDDMKVAEIKAVSVEAEKLGVKVGMKGQEALEKFK